MCCFGDTGADTNRFDLRNLQGRRLPGAGLAEPAVLHHGRGRADAGGRAAGRAQVTLVQELQQLLFRRATSVLGKQARVTTTTTTRPPADPAAGACPREPTCAFALADHVHGGGEVPHLDAAVGVAGEQVAPRPRAHPAGALALPHRERGDRGAVDRLDLADPARHDAQL